MELIDTNEAGLTVRFTNEEYAAVMRITHSASIDYENLSRGFLGLSRERVELMEDKIFEMSKLARSLGENAKR